MMPPTQRIFLAINLPAAERRAIHDAISPLREAAAGVAWVAEEKLHLTLKFLGGLPGAVVDDLRDALAPAMAAAPVPSLAIGGLGAFPDLRKPRVVWLGVEADAKLELLHHDIESVCGFLGYEIEGRAFRPHITLGRVRDGLAPEAARALADAARGVHHRARLGASSVEIMESSAGARGSVYRVVASLPLQRGG
jgi:2'-5' RNA ligase